MCIDKSISFESMTAPLQIEIRSCTSHVTENRYVHSPSVTAVPLANLISCVLRPTRTDWTADSCPVSLNIKKEKS